jgi:hypothetical protein
VNDEKKKDQPINEASIERMQSLHVSKGTTTNDTFTPDIIVVRFDR